MRSNEWWFININKSWINQSRQCIPGSVGLDYHNFDSNEVQWKQTASCVCTKSVEAQLMIKQLFFFYLCLSTRMSNNWWYLVLRGGPCSRLAAWLRLGRTAALAISAVQWIHTFTFRLWRLLVYLQTMSRQIAFQSQRKSELSRIVSFSLPSCCTTKWYKLSLTRHSPGGRTTSHWRTLVVLQPVLLYCIGPVPHAGRKMRGHATSFSASPLLRIQNGSSTAVWSGVGWGGRVKGWSWYARPIKFLGGWEQVELLCLSIRHYRTLGVLWFVIYQTTNRRRSKKTKHEKEEKERKKEAGIDKNNILGWLNIVTNKYKRTKGKK